MPVARDGRFMAALAWSDSKLKAGGCGVAAELYSRADSNGLGGRMIGEIFMVRHRPGSMSQPSSLGR